MKIDGQDEADWRRPKKSEKKAKDESIYTILVLKNLCQTSRNLSYRRSADLAFTNRKKLAILIDKEKSVSTSLSA